MALAVVGPDWTATPNSPVDVGRFPLGVESATINNAALLVPTATTGTAHLRYILTHAQLAARSRSARWDLDTARYQIRRTEVILGALSVLHERNDAATHDGTIPFTDPHGAARLEPHLSGGSLPVAALAAVPATSQTYSRQAAGFFTVYRGAEVAAGLIDAHGRTFRPGPVRAPHVPGLADDLLTDFARQDSVAIDELKTAAPDGCLCAVRAHAPALRGMLFGGPGAARAPTEIHHYRLRSRASARLLLLALDGRPRVIAEDTAMAEFCLSGADGGVPPELGTWADRWAGAVLRNASVIAWRWLWRWLTDQLRDHPRTAAELGGALADSLVAAAGRNGATRELLESSLPSTGPQVQYDEATLLNDATSNPEALPWHCLRIVALGVQRRKELAGAQLSTFLTPAELGADYAAAWLDEVGGHPIADAGRNLAAALLRKAEEISRQRARWEGTRLRLPSRLRHVGDVLDMFGEEGSALPGLRLVRLRQLLVEAELLTGDTTNYRIIVPEAMT